MIRVRLKFESTPVSYAQKCWFTFDTEKCKLVSDVSHLICSHFALQKNSHGIQLYMDEYLVPTNESARVFRDNDSIQVKVIPVLSDSGSSSSDDSVEEKESSVTNSKRRKLMQKKVAGKEGSSGKPPAPPKPPPVKKVVGVTKKLPSGGLHTKFCSASSSSSSTSSSSSSSSEDSDSSSSSSTPPTLRKRPAPPPASASFSSSGGTTSLSQWDVMKKSHAQLSSRVPNRVSSEKEKSMKALPVTHYSPALPATQGNTGRGGGGGGNALRAKPVAAKRTASQKRNARRKKKMPAVIGGPSDVLTTKSLVLTSPVGDVTNVKVTALSKRNNAAPSAAHVEGEIQLAEEEEEERQGAEGVERKEGECSASSEKGDACRATSGDGALSASEGSAGNAAAGEQQTTRDYSSFAALKGMPRVGDKLAFKTLEMSSSYTPELSEFMEAGVVDVNHDSSSVKLRYTEHTLSRLAEKAAKRLAGKFSLDAQASEQEDMEEEIELALSDMLTPVLIT